MYTSQQQNLGIILSNQLSWTPHLNSAISREYKTLFLLNHSISTHHFCRMYLQLSSTSHLLELRLLAVVTSGILNLYITSALWKESNKATKFIPNDCSSDYRQILVTLNLLPNSLWLELKGILLIIAYIKKILQVHFNIFQYYQFITRSARFS